MTNQLHQVTLVPKAKPKLNSGGQPSESNQFQLKFQFHLLSINPKYNLTKDTLLLRTYMITTIKTKNYRLTILKIMIKATYMIVFKIDRLRRSSLSR